MKTNNYGEIELTEIEAFNALYTGKVTSLNDMYVDFVEQFNKARQINADRITDLKTLPEHTETIDIFDKSNQDHWFMPDEYKNMDIETFLVNQCPKQNYDRLITELKLFRQHNMMDVLLYCKYLVDTMQENKIIWGVGRGSSVASYVLYLIGIHKIDSVKYKLDINEFLK